MWIVLWLQDNGVEGKAWETAAGVWNGVEGKLQLGSSSLITRSMMIPQKQKLSVVEHGTIRNSESIWK